MTRQLDIEREKKESARRDALVRALEYSLPGSLEAQGITLLGFTMKYDAWDCLLTLRADIGGVRHVAFVGSDSITNCFLKADSGARSDTLRWGICKYHQNKD